jgi:hypothetical protein
MAQMESWLGIVARRVTGDRETRRASTLREVTQRGIVSPQVLQRDYRDLAAWSCKLPSCRPYVSYYLS